MESFEFKIKDEKGMHMRPAGIISEIAAEFPCDITIKKEGEKAIGAKSVFAIMSLAIKQGEIITIVCNGEREKDASSKLKDFLENNM